MSRTSRAEPSADAPPPLPDPYVGAGDRLRKAVNWLIAALGAVAAASIGGLSLATLNSFSPLRETGFFLTAAAGAALALVGVLAALLRAAKVAADSTITAGDLTGDRSRRGWRKRLLDELAGSPQVVGWAGSKGGEAPRRFVADFAEQVTEYDRLRHPTLGLGTDPVPSLKELGRVGMAIEWMRPRFEQLLHEASYLRLRREFVKALAFIGVCAVVAITGISMFVWATSAANTPRPTELTRAHWSVPSELRTIVARELGATCGYDLDDVPVVAVLDADAEAAVIVTAPTDTCASVQITDAASRLIEDRR